MVEGVVSARAIPLEGVKPTVTVATDDAVSQTVVAEIEGGVAVVEKKLIVGTALDESSGITGGATGGGAGGGAASGINEGWLTAGICGGVGAGATSEMMGCPGALVVVVVAVVVESSPQLSLCR